MFRLEVVRDPVEHLVENTAGLTGADHVHEDRREHLGVLAQRVRERLPGLDVLADAG